MVMLGKLKEKLGNEDMPMPGVEIEVGGEGDEMGEEAPEAKPVDLSAVSDDDILAEAKARGLM
jgi:hypothetical protein